jgi:serine/threonine-protein kinase
VNNRRPWETLAWDGEIRVVDSSMVGRIFLGRYEAIRLLGEGGMGRVYLARQIDLGRQVVVKVMHDHIASDPKFCERFQRETLLMARFQHPYAVTLYDASLNDPQGPCIIMEYIRGITLDTLLKRNGRLTPNRVGRLLGQLCEALQAAHSQGIIHRDLKPANLMVVDPDTPYEKIKVMDFGLAKLIQSTAMPMISEAGTEFAVGTPGYISPEQVRGEEMDQRGDLYSVGVIVYELLTGRMPFDGRSTMDILLAHATEDPPGFATVGASDWVPPAIEAVVLACLAKQPTERPANARELAERFETALAHEEVVQEQAVSAQPPHLSPGAGPRGAGQLVVPQTDPSAVVHHLEAWMPERIAAYKLRGFVNDVGGEVIESIAGLIRVRLGGRGSVYQSTPGALSWLGLGRKAGLIDMELHLERADPTRESLLHIIVVMRSPTGESAANPEWRARCNHIFCDLRGYLMGQTGSVYD